MGLDIQKIGQNFAASFTGEGLNMLIGNKAQDAIGAAGAAGNMLPGLFGAGASGGVKKCNLNQGDNSAMGNQGFQFPGNSQSAHGAQQQNPMKQLFDFTLNLVKTVLEFAKGSANQATAAAKGNAETTAAGAAGTAGTGTAGTGTASATTPAVTPTTTTPAATTPPATTTAAPGSAATAPTEKAGTAAKTDDLNALLSKFKEMVGQLEKQMSALTGSLEKAVKGGKKGSKSSKSSKSSKEGFQSLIDKGLKFGTDILKFSKMFGI